MTGSHRLLRSLAQAVSWHRRKLAAVAAAAAVVAAISAAAPPGTPTSQVLVTTASLPGGVVLSAADLQARRLPRDALPERTVADPTELVGRTLVAPLPAGSVLTELSVLSPRTLTDPGEVIAPVRVSDPTVAALLRVGDRIDVVAGDADGAAKVLAPDLRIVALPADPASTGLGVGTGGSGAGTLVLVAATQAQATALVDAGGELGVILH